MDITVLDEDKEEYGGDRENEQALKFRGWNWEKDIMRDTAVCIREIEEAVEEARISHSCECMMKNESR